MCLILFALNQHPEYKLILAANRDEFFNRSTLFANFWTDNNLILAGRDILSQGTWLGLNKNGRFIAITNYRDPKIVRDNAKSRGELSKNFLVQNQNISDFLAEISKNKNKYNGFNLLLSEDSFDTLYHYSNVSHQTTQINSGIHGLSNHLLDTPWPKIESAKMEISKIIKTKSIDVYKIVEMLRNEKEAPNNLLPDTGISCDLEKKLSPVFISMKGYGTRCSTVILIDKSNNLKFLEVSYNEYKEVIGENMYEVQLMTQ